MITNVLVNPQWSERKTLVKIARRAVRSLCVPSVLSDGLMSLELWDIENEGNKDTIEVFAEQTKKNISLHIKEWDSLYPGWADKCRKNYLKECIKEIEEDYIAPLQKIHVEAFRANSTMFARITLEQIKALKTERDKLLDELNWITNKHLRRDADINHDMIERARNYPFQDLLSRYEWKGGKSSMWVCQIHSDKGPSFHVRRKDNRAHCYGCDWKNGHYADTIDLVMEIEGVEWKEAVRKLQ